MKAHYTDFINHSLRLYIRYQLTDLESSAEQQNWIACERACEGLDEDEMELVREIYLNKQSIAHTVNVEARNRGIPSDDIWELIHRVEKSVAKERGLI